MAKLTEEFALTKARAFSLQNIRKLNLWGCELTDVSMLRQMPSLTVTTLSSNQISSLADVACCTQLEELYLRCNNVADLSELAHLQRLSRLRYLWLEGNPVTKHPDYRLVVLKLLPRLERLDNIPVEDDEILSAKKLQLDPVFSPDIKSSAAIIISRDSESRLHYSKSANSLDHEHSRSNRANISLNEPSAGRPHKPSNLVGLSLDAGDPGIRSPSVAGAIARKSEQNSHMSTPGPSDQHRTYASMLEAVLCLLSELEPENLQVVADAVRNRLESL